MMSRVCPTGCDVLRTSAKNVIRAICCLAAVAMTATTASAQTGLAIGEVIGIDFNTTAAVFGTGIGVPPAAGTNFNDFSVQTLDMETASFAGALITLDGTTTDVGFSVTNNSGKASGLTGIDGAPGPAPFDDPTIGVDNYGAANVGSDTRADTGELLEDGNFVFTFSGLDDSLGYEVTGGYLHGAANDNFNTTWDISGQSATTFNTSGLPDAGYITLSDLTTDGAGNLAITVTRSVQLFVAGLTLTGTEAPIGGGDGLNCDSAGGSECDLVDIDALYADFGTTIAAGSGFDYSGDGVIGSEDIIGWLADASQSTNTANPNGVTYTLGDANLDGAVNSVDLGLLLNNFNASSGVGWGQGELDGDGIVNSVDLGLLLNSFGFTSVPAAASAVPEPNGSVMVVLALGFLCLAKRRIR